MERNKHKNFILDLVESSEVIQGVFFLSLHTIQAFKAGNIETKGTFNFTTTTISRFEGEC